MYEIEIQSKIQKLSDEAKKEVLDFVEFLFRKYNNSNVYQNDYQNKNNKNPLLEIVGFVEIGSMDSKLIDKEVYKL